MWLQSSSTKSARSVEPCDPPSRRAGALSVGEANLLLATRLDRMSRSVVDFAALMAAATDERWLVVALDLGLDTSTTTGRMVAHILAAVAEAEREVIGQRPSLALLAKRRRGERVGRPTTLPETVISQIVTARGRGSSLTAIARELDEQGVPPAQGGQRWHASTVHAVLGPQAAQAVQATHGWSGCHSVTAPASRGPDVREHVVPDL